MIVDIIGLPTALSRYCDILRWWDMFPLNQGPRVAMHDISPSKVFQPKQLWSSLVWVTYGVKQGCSMSPILSNIFQNDLHDIFQGSDPIKMGDIHFNSLSWADDLSLLPASESGLQSCLNQLQNYCRQWGITINTKKTKSMVFSSSRWTPTKMFIGETPIECVKNFQYLGFHLSYKFKNLIADREAKAMKMANMVHRALRTSNNVSIKLSMSLLDKQITPILLYGSAVWGIARHSQFDIFRRPTRITKY